MLTYYLLVGHGVQIQCTECGDITLLTALHFAGLYYNQPHYFLVEPFGFSRIWAQVKTVESSQRRGSNLRKHICKPNLRHTTELYSFSEVVTYILATTADEGYSEPSLELSS